MTVIIQSREQLLEGVEALCSLDPRFLPLLELCGEPPLRLREGGFEGLAWIIVSQQVSVASARAIWARTKGVFEPFTPQCLADAPDEDFRAGGLSMPKIRALRALAQVVLDGLDLDALRHMDADAAHAALVRVKGIGPWTADIYLMFCLGHSDAFAAGDLALQEAARLLLDLEARPNAQALHAIAQGWRPWRSVAARMLFAYYARMKNRAGLPLPDIVQPEGREHDRRTPT